MPWRSTGGWQCLAMLGWTALALSPPRARWAGAARLFAGRVVPVLLAVAYVALFARNGMADGGYGSLAEVRRLFAVPELLAAAGHNPGWTVTLILDRGDGNGPVAFEEEMTEAKRDEVRELGREE